MPLTSLAEYRRRKFQEEKDYIYGLGRCRFIDVSNNQTTMPYVKTEDIYFCNQKVDKCAVIDFRKTYNRLKSISKCKDYKDKFREVYDYDEKQTVLFLDKPNIKVYIGYSKNHGVYFNLKSPALKDDIVLMDSSEYKEIKKCMSLKNNVFNNTEKISNICSSVNKIIDLLHVTHGDPRIPLNC